MKKNEIKQNKSTCITYTKKEISNFKKLTKLELYSDLNNNTEDLNEDNNSPKDENMDNIYFSRYTQYTMHEFNSKIVNMIIVYFNLINLFPNKLKKEPNFINKIINMLKHLLMNELEVACFTILLDKIGYDYINAEQWLFFTFVGIEAKKLCGKSNDIILIIKYFSRNIEKFSEGYALFSNDKTLSEKINKKKITIKEINKRFIYLSKPVNSYCRKNYVNIDGIVDKIVKLSQPYFMKEKSRNNKKKKKFFSTKVINTKNNFSFNEFNNKSSQLSQFENYINILNNNNEINLENIFNLNNNINNNLDGNENNNNYEMDFSLSKFDSINSIKFDEIKSII